MIIRKKIILENHKITGSETFIAFSASFKLIVIRQTHTLLAVCHNYRPMNLLCGPHIQIIFIHISRDVSAVNLSDIIYTVKKFTLSFTNFFLPVNYFYLTKCCVTPQIKGN